MKCKYCELTPIVGSNKLQCDCCGKPILDYYASEMGMFCKPCYHLHMLMVTTVSKDDIDDIVLDICGDVKDDIQGEIKEKLREAIRQL